MSEPFLDALARLPQIRFGREVCGDLAAAERREWWLANGRGGYAAGTVALSLTRRYRALLVAPVDPPLGRVLVLGKADATLEAEGRLYPLITNRWATLTPRIGKPVEINALWYNALCGMTALAGQLGRQAGEYRNAAERTRQSFARFVMSAEAGLHDVIDGPGGPDSSLRPNQILAVSLWASPLDRATQRAVLRRCAAALLTSYGLRSLAPDDPDYHGRYEGGVVERDGGYHQGPVWPWLLGHYALAHYRVHDDAAAAQLLLRPIGDHLFDAGLGQVSEIFDGDPPHAPRGCPAQAWSVACALEAWWCLELAKTGSS